MKLEDCCITVECLPEDLPIKGNASAIDEATDRQIVRKIKQELAAGNEWAWCCVRVTVEYEDNAECEYLGCCNYKNRHDFIKNSGHYQDMVKECFERLVARLGK